MKQRGSFSTLFGGEQKAADYLNQLTAFAASTPFEYDDLTAISKSLKTFGYAVDDMIPTLTKVGDAGAALGLSASDISTVTTYIGRMKSSDKATLEYLNPLNERGFSVFQWIADDLNTTITKVYEKISKGELSGSYVSDLILKQFQGLYGGMMQVQSQTYTGLTSTLQDAQTQLNNSMGEGYNQTRKQGIQSEIDFLFGETGADMQEAYNSIGAWQADLENQKEKFIRDAINSAINDPNGDYQKAKAEGDAAEMGRIIMAAKVQGMNEYNASDGASLARQADLDLASSIQGDTSSDSAYWDAGYQKGQQFSKGLMAGMFGGYDSSNPFSVSEDGYTYTDSKGHVHIAAYGLSYVPYDNFPARLHQGERVLTAAENRNYNKGSQAIQVNITGNSFGGSYTAEDVAREFAEKLNRAMMLSVSN